MELGILLGINISIFILALCALGLSLFAVAKVWGWEKREVQLYPVNNPTTSGLERFQKELEELSPLRDDAQADFENIGVKTDEAADELV